MIFNRKYVLFVLLAAGLGLMIIISQIKSNPAAASTLAPGAERPVAPSDVQVTIDQVIASGFSSPVQVTNAADSSDRLFVVEQTGKIRIIQNGQALATPFIDLTALIACCGERGLLGLAFHPNYAVNGFFYVNYTRSGDGATVVARYTVSANPNVANPASAQTLLTIPQPYSNHNGGQVMFGPDGYLYIGMGDGGSAGDPQNYAQNIESLLGKLLRLDVNSGSPYANPPDNPYVGRAGRDEIWAIGLRNPWRFSFDRLTGDLYIGDVGQNLWEEIDFQAANTPGGVNFGWRCREGSHNYNFTGACPSAILTDPIAEYNHSEGHSVSAGFVYRGNDFPSLNGRYFYADYVDGKLWSIYQTSNNPITWSAPELELSTGLNISAFGEDEDGELYVVDYSGKIRRLADVNGPSPRLTNSQKQVSTPSADPFEVVTYTIRLSNTGGLADRPIFLTDTLPAGLDFIPGSLHASSGAWSEASIPTLTWQGNLADSPAFTITYQAMVTGQITGSIVNQAQVLAPPDISFTLGQSLTTPRSVLTTTTQDFILPGTQPNSLSAAIPDSVDCDTCHSQPIYDLWRGSMMSQAGRDPLMWAALHVANIDAPNSGEFCLRCHTAKGWLDGRSHPSDGSALLESDLSNGVGCALCHRLVDPVSSAGDETASIDAEIRNALVNPIPAGFNGSASLIVDPQDRRRGPFSFGAGLAYHSAFQTDFLGQSSNAVTRARMCGSCHNVHNPVLSWDADREQFWPNAMDSAAPAYNNETLFPIETTFDEWLYSDFAAGGVFLPQFAAQKPGGVVETCQDCHMPRRTGSAADPAFNPVSRDCQTSGCLPEHFFAGANTWTPQLLQDPDWRLNALGESSFLQNAITQSRRMLQQSASITVTLTDNGANKLAAVRVTNHTGHKLPTGYPEGRQMWINLKAYNSLGSLIYESGVYDTQTGQLQRDAAIKVYEAKQGITPELASVLGLPEGESFHFVLNNRVIKDNRIPPRGVSQAEYDRPGLRPVGATYQSGQYWDDSLYTLPGETVRVIAALYYQTSSKEYIDFLRQNGGLDGLAVGSLWEGLKSPPEIVAWIMTPGINRFLPLVVR